MTSYRLFPHRFPRRVYCAGPLFNAAERMEMEQIAARLQGAGFSTFVPHADGMEFAQVHPYLVRRGYDAPRIGQILHEAIFALDVYQVVDGCGSLVFNMNGRVPDEGAAAEMSMAWMLGKPLVIFKEDARSAIAGRDNPLLVGQSRFRVVSSMDRIASALEEELALCEADSDAEFPCPPHLAQAASAGARLWERLAALGELRPHGEVALAVLDIFGDRELVAEAR